MTPPISPQSTAQQKTVVIISQVYVPDPTAVGQYMADMAETMVARGWRVIVLTSDRGYDNPSLRYIKHEKRAGVEIRRLPFSSFGKKNLARRLFAQIIFSIQATVRVMIMRQLDTIVASTSPPFAGFFAAVASFVRGRPFVWWVMDLNPDQLILAGSIKESSLSARCFDTLNRFTIKKSVAIVALDRFVKDRLLRKANAPNKIHILPLWPTAPTLQPVATTESEFRKSHFPSASRIVMYSGNHGLSTPVTPLLEAARCLEADDRLHFAFVGGGVMKDEIDRRINLYRLHNTLSFPYQPLTALGDSLGAADVHVISITAAAVGACHSCKIYNAMSLGKPILALAPKESHISDILTESKAGWIVQPDDVESLTATLRMISTLSDDTLKKIGNRGREFVHKHFKRERLLSVFCDVVT